MPGAGEPLISLDASSRYFIILPSCQSILEVHGRNYYNLILPAAWILRGGRQRLPSCHGMASPQRASLCFICKLQNAHLHEHGFGNLGILLYIPGIKDTGFLGSVEIR